MVFWEKVLGAQFSGRERQVLKLNSQLPGKPGKIPLVDQKNLIEPYSFSYGDGLAERFSAVVATYSQV